MKSCCMLLLKIDFINKMLPLVLMGLAVHTMSGLVDRLYDLNAKINPKVQHGCSEKCVFSGESMSSHPQHPNYILWSKKDAASHCLDCSHVQSCFGINLLVSLYPTGMFRPSTCM